MTTGERIEQKLKADLEPTHLEVSNESNRHNVPPGSETHFKVVVVSAAFRHKSPVSRHRMIYHSLDAELRGGVHALALHTLTPEEWEQQGSAPKSPPCAGGAKDTAG